jgi:uncharacterized membrane protein YvlD (DUF360 family)
MSPEALRAIKRFTVNLVVTLLVLLLCDLVLPGFRIASPQAAVLAVLLISFLNTYVRPTIIRLTLSVTMLTLGGLAIVLNGLIVLFVSWLDPGFHVAGLGTAILVSFGLAVANMLVTSSILTNADQELHEYAVIQRFARTKRSGDPTTIPGLILIEIDGLSEPVLRKAIDAGHMPNLAAWLKSGQYQLVGWETGLPSQTSAMQAGILHGSHFNIPAFRFYDKAKQRLLVSGHPPDAAVMLAGIANGEGVLRDNGFCVNNWAHGDAGDVVLTMSTLALKVQSALSQSDDLFGYFANAYNVQRTLIKTFIDVVVELYEAWNQRRTNVLPRVSRRFPYPIVRAVTTALLPDISCYLIIQKMFEGVDVAYSTLVSYDEVAHHSGIDRSDTDRVLRQLDGQIRWIAHASAHAPRNYDVVILSDHGQSQGATFRQRYGVTLLELVTSLMNGQPAIAPDPRDEEGVERLNALASELAAANHLRAKLLQWLFRRHTTKGYVDLKRRGKTDVPVNARAVVCPSGNLGLIYFPEWPERLTLEQIQSHFPGLVEGLVAHPGIAFVLATSGSDGAIVLGKNGRLRLSDGAVEGEDPLALFGPRAAEHLREVSAYPNQGDLAVNSLYDPTTGEVAAFEELVGSHGGLGGWQNCPFLLYPSRLATAGPPSDLIGASAIYHVIQRWRAAARLPSEMTADAS